MFNLKEYTMKMKSIFNKKILIAIATISSLSLQSCLDDDDNYAMRFPNALVTVKTDADQTVFLQLDDKTSAAYQHDEISLRREGSPRFSKLQGSGRAQRYLHPSCTYKLDRQYPYQTHRPGFG